MNVIMTACVFSRPEIYAQVLASYRDVPGIRDILYVPVFEYGYNPACLEALEKAEWLSAAPVFNKKRLGVDYNTWEALRIGFSEPRVDAVIHAEDDLLWTKDTLAFLLWGLKEYQQDSSIFSIGAHCSEGRGLVRVPRDQYYTTFREDWFTPWGWATWRDRSFDIFAKNPLDNPAGWDHTMNHVVRKGRGLIRPHYSRIKHIGTYGVHVNGEEWAHEESGDRDWAGKDRIPVANFKKAGPNA